MFFNLFYLGFPEFHSFIPEFPKHHHGRSCALCPAPVATRLFFRLRLPLFLELRKVSYKVFHWWLFWAQPGSGTRPSLMHVTTSKDFWKSIKLQASGSVRWQLSLWRGRQPRKLSSDLQVTNLSPGRVWLPGLVTAPFISYVVTLPTVPTAKPCKVLKLSFKYKESDGFFLKKKKPHFWGWIEQSFVKKFFRKWINYPPIFDPKFV